MQKAKSHNKVRYLFDFFHSTFWWLFCLALIKLHCAAFSLVVVVVVLFCILWLRRAQRERCQSFLTFSERQQQHNKKQQLITIAFSSFYNFYDFLIKLQCICLLLMALSVALVAAASSTFFSSSCLPPPLQFELKTKFQNFQRLPEVGSECCSTWPRL